MPISPEHGRDGSKVFLGLLPPDSAPVQLAETEMTVRDERTHAELSPQGLLCRVHPHLRQSLRAVPR